MKPAFLLLLALAGPALALPSPELGVYPDHPTARSRSVNEILERTSTPEVQLAPGYSAKRQEIVQMYRNFGIDLSLTPKELRTFLPRTWSKQTPQPLLGPYRQPYSVDSTFYQPIPTNSPRVALPVGYINSVSFAARGGTNTQQGFIIADKNDPPQTLRRLDDNQILRRRLPLNILDAIPAGGTDKHLTIVDSTDNTVFTCFQAKLSEGGGRLTCKYTAGPTHLGNLGDQGGGTNATKIPNLAMVLREGEANNPNQPIPHALTGPIGQNWKAIVYPGLGMDKYIQRVNTGLVPYGGILQLDPKLDLKQIQVDGRSLSLPARRILEAIQTYGFYVNDNRPDRSLPGSKGTSLSVWTVVRAEELSADRGKNLQAVQAEVRQVLNQNTLYVVPPVVKKS
ncbi:hypothetical protein [Candidatus Cyanaurora vandensis]|uniref:hypothetical protein n=2 Tax=Candidatus Cyanaurora vandensis TaxID=2714958 RepID=UPI0025795E76|nr:hypothetical protein [Candidatus Cyanaurora vandensis]